MPGIKGVPPTVLIVDDDPDVCRVVKAILAPQYRVTIAPDPVAGLVAIEGQEPELVLLDLNLGDGVEGGLDLLHKLRARDPHLPVLVLSSYKDTDTIVRAMKAGAAHFIGKTPRHDELLERLRLTLLERDQLRRLEAQRDPNVSDILGASEATAKVRDLAQKAATCDLPVLILGETGTGKGLVARCIHRQGPRAEGPFRDVNVAGLPTSILDSELFGHERGAFTGADRRRLGLFELARGGSILLDEIGDLPRECQVKLLKVVEDHTFRRVGGENEIQADIRILAATNADLVSLVSARAFREDLYHRLAGLVIEIPPLRARPQDIPLLARAFVGPSWQFTGGALDALSGRPWPGNVRELQQTVRRATLFASGDQIDVGDLDTCAPSVPFPASGAPDEDLLALPYDEAIHRGKTRLQCRYLSRLLTSCGSNVSLAARRSGLSRSHLHSLISQLGLQPDESASTRRPQFLDPAP